MPACMKVYMSHCLLKCIPFYCVCIFIHIGFAFHFCIQSIVFTWFLHAFHLFLGAAFPFRARFLSEKKWKIRCHVIEVIGCIIFCSLGPTLVLSLSEYTITSFPTLFPLPTKEMVFITMTIPLSVLLAAGVNMIFYTFFCVHKVDI